MNFFHCGNLFCRDINLHIIHSGQPGSPLPLPPSPSPSIAEYLYNTRSNEVCTYARIIYYTVYLSDENGPAYISTTVPATFAARQTLHRFLNFPAPENCRVVQPPAPDLRTWRDQIEGPTAGGRQATNLPTLFSP